MKTKIKYIFSFSLVLNFLFNTAFGAVIHYNVVDIKSESFNAGLPVNTGNQAGVQILRETTFSGSTPVSDSTYNIVDIKSDGFNFGLPVNSGKQAKVVIDKTSVVSLTGSVKNDANYNIVDIKSESFNFGLPVNSGKQAKVLVSHDLLNTQSGTYIYGSDFYNIVDIKSESFNFGLPVNSGKQAKVLVAKVKWEDGVLTVDKDSNYNLVDIKSESFNFGLPVNSGKQARVNFEKNEKFYEDQQIGQETGNDPEVGEVVYTDVNINQVTAGYSKDYTNSTRYIFQAVYKNNKNINLQNIAGHIYNKRGSSNTVVIGDKGLFQGVIDKNPTTKEKLSYEKNNNFIVTDGEIYKTESSILQVILTGSVVVPPVLTYPYPEIVGTGANQQQKYVLRTNYPIIKGMAYPNSILEVKLGGETLYTKVDKYGLFEFTPSKKVENGTKEIIFQYIMLENNERLSSLANKKLLYSKKYTLEVEGNQSLEFPYITSIYNDDYIYTNIFYLEGFGNPGTPVNYKLMTMTGGTIKAGTVGVNATTKKFSMLLGERGLELSIGQDYIIEVWQGSGLRERKAFTLVGNTIEEIGILNLKNFSKLPTTIPKFIGYSRENILNNDAIYVYACDITGSTPGSIKPCISNERQFLGTVSADKNGIFEFQPIQPMKDNSYYEFEFIHTEDLKKNKKIVIQISTGETESLYNSQITTIFDGLHVPQGYLNLNGFTLPHAEVEIDGSVYNANQDGLFFIKKYVGNNTISVKYSTGGVSYEQNYQVILSDQNINTTLSNYFQQYTPNTQKIVFWRAE